VQICIGLAQLRVLILWLTYIKCTMQTLLTYGCTADHLIQVIEAAETGGQTTRAHRARHWLPLLQLLLSAAAMVARKVDRANRAA
jgi:hypothetical protein